MKPDTTLMKSDDIVLPKLPEPSGFREWRADVRNEVKSAYPKPDEAFDWILELEDADKGLEDFAA